MEDAVRANQELRGDSFQFSNALTYFFMKRFSYLIVGGIVLAVAAWFVWAILRDKQLQKGFDEIAAEAAVLIAALNQNHQHHLQYTFASRRWSELSSGSEY